MSGQQGQGLGMRLVCPNCGAQYEVPDEVIPSGGRDVQCSSCGHTWFQAHPDQDRDLADELETPVPDDEWTPPAATEPELAKAVYSDDEAEEDAPAAPQQTRRQLDPKVADLLREEAEMETRARAAAQQPTLESQPDLGLDEPEELDEAERRAREARIRMARIRGIPETDERPAPPREDDAMAAAAMANSRRDLLPDIDEINSTLRSGSERRASAVEEAERDERPVQRKSGFKRGFLFALVLFALAVVAYVYAPQIRERVTQVDPYLAQYVEQVDRGRAGLKQSVADLLTWLDSMSSSAGAAPDVAPEAASDQ